MIKKILTTLLVAIMSLSLVSCGGTTSSTGGNAEKVVDNKNGLFSAVGGWKEAELGVIWIIDQDGTGLMINEIPSNDESVAPFIYKADITWEEGEETVGVKMQTGDYTLQKKKDGNTESLDLGGISYIRLSDAEVNEYKEKAASASSMGTPEVTDDSGKEELVLDEPITVIDNEKVTVKFIRFFSEVMNKGTNNEWCSAGFDIEVENKMKDYEVSLYPRDCSLSDRRVIEFAINGNNTVAPGKIATMTFTRLDQKPFDDLNALYELEGNFDLTVKDDKYSYSDLGGKLAFSIQKSRNAVADAEEAGENRAAYSEVFAKISENMWLFNGGGDTILNYIEFKEDKATIGQVYYDGNGKHDNGVNECNYTISDESITVITAEGGEIRIPYSMSDGKISLGDGEYLTLEQVEEGLQGYWKYTDHSDLGNTDSEGYLLVDHGTLKSESASEVQGGAKGEYYYYGPYEGTYTLGVGVFDTDLFKGRNWFYNIIDGVPTVLRYDKVCERADGFPGENGYVF